MVLTLPWCSDDRVIHPKQSSGCTPAWRNGAKRKKLPKENPRNSVKTKIPTASINPTKIRYITNSVSNNLFLIMHLKKKTKQQKYKIDFPPWFSLNVLASRTESLLVRLLLSSFYQGGTWVLINLMLLFFFPRWGKDERLKWWDDEERVMRGGSGEGETLSCLPSSAPRWPSPSSRTPACFPDRAVQLGC